MELEKFCLYFTQCKRHKDESVERLVQANILYMRKRISCSFYGLKIYFNAFRENFFNTLIKLKIHMLPQRQNLSIIIPKFQAKCHSDMLTIQNSLKLRNLNSQLANQSLTFLAQKHLQHIQFIIQLQS